MLIYLDGRRSTKYKPNENYARELMELFTMSIGHYTEQDVAEAARALALTEKSIKQIALECGFTNRYYFTRVFTRRIGMGPAAYRRQAVKAVPKSVRKP